MPFAQVPLTFVMFVILSLHTFACCTTWRLGDPSVEIAAQDVLLIWDAEKGREHFVRRASFEAETAPDDFGFLVPTPTQPKLTEVSDSVFRELSEVIKPEVIVEKKTKLSLMPMLLYSGFATAGSEQAKSDSIVMASVEVLDTAIVGGFEATVLRASDASALLKWLEEHGYNARPEINDWVTPYVEKKWIITAFKYACEAERHAASLSRKSVCLSFDTEKPFFPYRVPSDLRVEPEDGSLLRIYFAGSERVEGSFENGKEWSAAPKFSDRDERMTQIIGEALGDSDAPDALWLTAFEDRTWPGGSDDLYFKTSSTKSVVKPAPIIQARISTLHLPLDLILLVVVIGFYLYRKFVKRQPASPLQN